MKELSREFKDAIKTLDRERVQLVQYIGGSPDEGGDYYKIVYIDDDADREKTLKVRVVDKGFYFEAEIIE